MFVFPANLYEYSLNMKNAYPYRKYKWRYRKLRKVRPGHLTFQRAI